MLEDVFTFFTEVMVLKLFYETILLPVKVLALEILL